MKFIQMSYVPNLKYKTTICENWLNHGNCHKGQICHFAHGQHELRTIEENQKSLSSKNSYIKSVAEQTNYPSNYKTIKCKFYQKGLCKLGSNCTFVHDNSERRPKPQPQNYTLYLPWVNYHTGEIQGEWVSENMEQMGQKIEIGKKGWEGQINMKEDSQTGERLKERKEEKQE